jgi:hypothetical protein
MLKSSLVKSHVTVELKAKASKTEGISEIVVFKPTLTLLAAQDHFSI